MLASEMAGGRGDGYDFEADRQEYEDSRGRDYMLREQEHRDRHCLTRHTTHNRAEKDEVTG
jgi:hypothetical protein